MSREKLLRVRLFDEEYKWLKDYADSTNRQNYLAWTAAITRYRCYLEAYPLYEPS